LDIRLADDAGVLRLFHGDVDQGTELEAGVLLPIQAFLEEHPGETVIVSVKQEDTADAARFARDFEEVAARHASLLQAAPDFRKLADGRGKIVVFRRFAGSAIGIPAPPAQWTNNATFEIPTAAGPLRIEDEWDLGRALPWQVDGKWDAVARNLDAAAAGAATDWYLTFSSGTGDLSLPRWIAGGIPFVAGMNRRLLDYVSGGDGPRRLGTIAMDFPELPDGRLIQSLVDTNRAAGSAPAAG
jgi:1-phosphatidylinositol phosphodiesterase